MSTVNPSQSNAGDLITAAAINNPVNQLAAVINGSIDATNIADGSVSTTKIADGAITGPKLAGGTGWTAWTPTLTNVTKGNGTETARYTQIGKTTAFYYSLVFGTTTTIGAISSKVTLPVAATSNINQYSTIGNANYFDTSVGTTYSGTMILDTSTVGIFQVSKVDVTYAFGVDVTTNIPMTWAVGDRLTISGTYEAA